MMCPECKGKLKAYCVRPVNGSVSRHYSCQCGFKGRSIEKLVPPRQDFGRRHWRMDSAGVVRWVAGAKWRAPRQSSNSL
jgi:hypothetical protein